MAEMPRYALSVRQPWAWAIIHGGKHLENRSRGALLHMSRDVTWLAIHASKGMTRDEYESALLTFEAAHRVGQLAVPLSEIPKPHELVRGAIIGTVRIVGRLNHSTSPWWCGPRALELRGATPCAPIPAPGALGFFSWDPGAHLTGAALEEPKPWMLHWPDGAPKRERAPRAEKPGSLI